MKHQIVMRPWLAMMVLISCNKSSSEKAEPIPIAPQSADAQALTYHKDIRPLMESKCSGCHSAGGLAGLELTRYAAVKPLRNAIKAAVQSRRMPPWIAEAGHQTYRDDLSLSEAQIKKISDWVDLGAEEGSPADYVAPIKPDLFTPDVTLPIFADGGSYLPDQSTADEYRCFVLPFDGRLGTQEFITGFTTLAGNKKIAHHLVAHTATAAIVPVLQELDASEEGRGYRCFGGALPDRLGDPAVQASLEAKYPGIINRLNSETHWLAHWAPGMDDGYAFPEGTGIKVPAGGAFVIQMHYYTQDAKGEGDQNTRFALKLASTVKKPAFYFPLTKNTWLDSRNNKSMVIPAKQSATFFTEVSLATVAAYGAQILNQPINTVKYLEVHSANLHMHELGASGRVTMGVAGGPEEVLLNIPEWDLHWQRDFPFVLPKVIAPADWSRTLNRVTCDYENPRETDAYGGFGSLDEMCFNFGFFAFDLGH
ncbi:MAG TPA: hypothetical protein VE954_15490 [Oligoflexus sp.]|uniref:hypothetical protein n=1 Tax=Oligoflexus sp. TaxID=1971216 RepID=UPI002D27CC81|nr:hypothetical protein [Oligoflexus sp.]HYX34507.1 hypothetical protein [Oligoflexus sp.]